METLDTPENQQTNWWKRLIHSKIDKKRGDKTGGIRNFDQRYTKILTGFWRSHDESVIGVLENDALKQQVVKTLDTLENQQKQMVNTLEGHITKVW